MRSEGVETLVLGCTHYPLLKPLIGRIMGGTHLIDSAEETAAETSRVLESKGLRRSSGGPPPTHRFIASDAAEQFRRLAVRFLGQPVERVETVTLG